jgi:hypothetical protein
MLQRAPLNVQPESSGSLGHMGDCDHVNQRVWEASLLRLRRTEGTTGGGISPIMVLGAALRVLNERLNLDLPLLCSWSASSARLFQTGIPGDPGTRPAP